MLPLLLRQEPASSAHLARLGSAERLISWARARKSGHPLAWFHAASVGEGLQTEVVIRALRVLRPDLEVLYTHFSPSALPLVSRMEVDHHDYLPYDRREEMHRVVAALQPALLVFGKLDLWPELACSAAAAGAGVALVAATVDPGSSRLRWPARSLLRAGYAALNAVAALDSDHAQRLIRLGVAPERITLTGDPRIDSAFTRLESSSPTTWPDTSGPILLAGSTWEADEAILLRSFSQVWADHPKARLILVPHQPTVAHLQQLEAAAIRHRLPPPVRWSRRQATDPLPPLTVVDSVGLLASLYPFASLAYVGGGYGARGIHSVLEPAAAGRMVVVGPHDRGLRDLKLLREVEAVEQLPGNDEAAVNRLTALWEEWIRNPATLAQAGARARNRLLQERGASSRSAELLAELIEKKEAVGRE